MNIVSRAEVKTILQITDSSKDGLIDALLPSIEGYILGFTNNLFTDPVVRISASTLSFVSGTPATITDSGLGFVEAGFVAGMAIYVEGTWFNDGYYSLDTVEAGTLTLATGEKLRNESPSSNRSVNIFRAKIPEAVKHAAAQMIDFLSKNTDGISTEKVGNYSVSYDLSKKGGFPENIIGKLSLFRRLKAGD